MYQSNTNMTTFKDFRCSHCKQLQFKYIINKNDILISVKCYACNSFSTLAIPVNKIITNDQFDKKIDIAQ